MAPRPARYMLLIIASLIVLWAMFLLIQRPVLRAHGVTGLDWNNVVTFPLLIVAAFMVARYVRWRNDPARRPVRAGVGEAIATAVVWSIVKAVQERYTFGAITQAPLVSGVVVCLAVLAGNWIIAKLSRRS